MALKYNGDGTHYWAPEILPCGRYGRLFKSAPDAPASPDYVGAAKEQGTANVEAARASSKLSNPDMYTPYGNQTVQYGISGDPDHASVTQTLSPEGMQLLAQDNRIKMGLGNLAEGGIGRVGGMLGTQFDMSQVPGQAQAGQPGWDKAYQSIIDRNQPVQDRDRSMMETQLANQGIMRGSEAYDNAMRDQAMKENDFRLGAQQQATGQQQAQYGMDQSARQDAISQQAYLRQLPLNEINALRSGAQIVNPQFQQYQGQQIAPPPIFGAVQAQGQYDLGTYNSQAAGASAGNAATTSAIGTIGAGAFMF